MKQDDPQFKLRIPADLKRRLDEEAEKNTRTLGAEIVARLQQSFNLEPLKEAKRSELESLVNQLIDHKFNTLVARARESGDSSELDAAAQTIAKEKRTRSS